MLNKKYTAGGLAILLGITIASPVQALPIFSSEESQTFNQNQNSTLLRDIHVTEDVEGHFIEKGFLTITIPDTLAIIFDNSRSTQSVRAYGTAVENGKVSERPEITFENKDKTVRIPILNDFAPGETLVLSQIYAEGFHSQPVQSDRMMLELNNNGQIYFDSNTLYIRTSSQVDTGKPEKPSHVTVVNTAEGVELSWVDPTDLDLQQIHIFRGENIESIDMSRRLTEVEPGIESYVDTQVQEGQTWVYLLRSADGRNYGDLTDPYTITVSLKAQTEEPQAPTTTEPGTTTDNGVTDDASGVDQPTISEPEADAFTDLDGHWSQTAVEALHAAGIVNGNPDGTYRPNENLNRAETAALLQRLIRTHENTSTELTQPANAPFTDTPIGTWFAPYVHNLKTRGFITGNPDGTYQPDENINRAEFITLVMRVYKALQNNPTMQSQSFSDVPAGAWYNEAVEQAHALDFVEGVACGTARCFEPNREITRAEAAQILYRLWQAL